MVANATRTRAVLSLPVPLILRMHMNKARYLLRLSTPCGPQTKKTDGNDNTFCQCDDDVGSSENSLYCDAWSCRQVSPGGRVEFEEYRCQRSSPSGDYCEAWNGNVTASDEVEVVTCECMANWHGDQVCSFWECEGA